MKTATATRTYVSPHAGRMPFGEHARQWMASWNTEATTSARDASVMRMHVLKQWESWPLAKIDHLAIQTWITGLSQRLSPATVGECRRLMSGVMRSAVRNRLIAYNPCEDIRVPKRRKQDTDDQVIARDVFRNKLLPAVPDRYRGLVAVAGGAGLRWGEAAGLCADAVDLDAGRLRVIRTVVEVAGHTRFKGYPKSAAGRRSVPLPGWLVEILREHTEQYGYGEADLLFGNEVGGAHRRTNFPGPRLASLARPGRPARLRDAGWRSLGGVVDRRRREASPRPLWTAKRPPSPRSPAGSPAVCAITI